MRDQKLDGDYRDLGFKVQSGLTQLGIATSLGDSDAFISQLDKMTAMIAQVKTKVAERKKAEKK